MSLQYFNFLFSLTECKRLHKFSVKLSIDAAKYCASISISLNTFESICENCVYKKLCGDSDDGVLFFDELPW